MAGDCDLQKLLPALRWDGPVLGSSGFGMVGRSLVTRLMKSGVSVEVSPILDSPAHRGSPKVGVKGRAIQFKGRQAEDLYAVSLAAPWMLDLLLPAFGRPCQATIRVSHSTPSGLPTVNPSAGRWPREIGYVAFEMDRLPPSWLSACLTADELWVPSTFCRRVLVESGIEERAVHVIPHGVDTVLFDPAAVMPCTAVSRQLFTFLSVFQWEYRKGWDLLLEAYLGSFRKEDDTQLVIATAPRSGDPSVGSKAAILEAVEKVVRRHGGAGRAPRIQILDAEFTDEEMPSLYRSADVFVLPSRGEGFGLPLLEAMAMGLPTLGTAWGGPLDFLDQAVGFPIPIREERLAPEGLVAPYGLSLGGARMGEPDLDVLSDLMRFVFENRGVAQQKGREARACVERGWSWARPVALALDRLSEHSPPPIRYSGRTVRAEGTAPEPSLVRVAWEGTFLARHSLSQVNRELASEVVRFPEFDLTLVPFESRTLSESESAPFSELLERTTYLPPDDAHVYIRHQWPPFLHRPFGGKWILMQPWEFGTIPRPWLPTLRNDVDQVWVPASIVKEMFVESGVPESKVRVVPHGVRPDVFSPGAEPLGLPTRSTCRFLYVGGCLPRKGLDILVRAYSKAFSDKDDVCLVIKESRAGGLYSGTFLDPLVDSLRRSASCPEVLRIDAEHGGVDLAGLYSACDAYVSPYRGEGFGLPILEAMACGLPVIVTAGGASDDFVTDDIGFRVPSRRVALPESRQSALDLCGAGWWLEPEFDSVVDLLRHVFEHRDEARSKGLRASDRIRRDWTWQRAATVVRGEILGLVGEHQIRSHAKGDEVLPVLGAPIPGLVPSTVGGIRFLTRLGTMDEAILGEVIVGDFYGFRGWRPKRAEESLKLIDIGAHVGGFSAWAAELYPAARIVAFECFPENAELARQNTDRFGGVQVVEAAVVGKLKPASMVVPVFPNTGGGSLRFGDGLVSGIPSCTLAEALSTYAIDRVDFLKLDCEGSEWDILEDAPPEVLGRIECLSMELHCDPATDRTVHRMGLFLKRFFREVASQPGPGGLLWRVSASGPRS